MIHDVHTVEAREDRAYQDRAISDLRSSITAGAKRIVLVAPTGSGKTVMACTVIKRAIAKGKRVFFLAHRRELIQQCSDKLDANGVDHGIIQANHWRRLPDLPVQVASVQTLVRRLHHIDEPPDLLIIDECHRSTAASYKTIIDRCPRSVLLGLTATPERGDGRGLIEVYEDMVQAATVLELLEHDPPYLVPARIWAPPTKITGKLHVKRGDYDVTELAAAYDKPHLIGDIVEHWQKLASDRLTCVFAVNVAHSQHLRDQFLAAGVPAEHVDGTTPTDERDAILARWRAGTTRVVTNCEVLTEGFDFPAMSCVILARRTKSVSRYLQMVGRGLRTAPGKKDCLVLDHAGLVGPSPAENMGFPQDDREWSLEGRPKGKPTTPGVKICPECMAAVSIGTRVCPECGHVWTVAEAEITHVDGDLQELDPALIVRRRRQEVARARTLYDLITIGKQRGYRYPERWAQYRWEGRQARARR